MKPEQQRIAIAEACGWKPDGEKLSTGVVLWNNRAWLNLKPYGDGYLCDQRVPDYLNDLNAMHEACVLYDRVNFVIEYERELHEVLLRDERHICEAGPFYWLATAAQRAEAFLKTIGKWEGGSDES